MRRQLLWLSVVIVLAMNAAALISVWMNRRGQPTNLIELTERELPVQHRDAGNSAVFVRLNWHGELPDPPDRFRPGLDWFDRAKLSEIGFDLSMPLTDPRAAVHYRRMRSRPAFLVLEYEGRRWREWLSWHAGRVARTGSPEERERLEREAEVTSRLFAVDAGLNGAELRARYPEQTRFLIVRASVRVLPVFDPGGEGRQLRDLRGHIDRLLVSQIYVPPPFSGLFRSIRPGGTTGQSYRLVLRYGSRYEPRVIDAEARRIAVNSDSRVRDPA